MFNRIKQRFDPEWLMAVRVSVTFFLIGSAWILFSDRLVFLFFNHPSEYTNIQSWKGEFFVVSVAVLLLFMIKNYLRRNQKLSDSLAQSELRFKKVIDKSVSGICITDRYGVFEYVNPAFCAIYGYDVREFLDGKIDMLVDEELKSTVLEVHAQLFDRNEGRQGTWAVRDRSGKSKTVVVDTVPITWINGEKRLVTFVSDVTEKIKAEEQLRRSEQRYRNMMEQLDVPLYITDNDCRIVFANKAFRDSFGDIRNDTFCYRKIMGANKKCQWCKEVTDLKMGEKFESEYFRESDGRIFQTIMVPVEFEPGVMRKMVVLRDLTEILQDKKRAEESDRLKTAFLANMSHEVRTPLNAILGFSTILNDDTLPKDEKGRFVDLIHQSGLQLLNIIDDIVDVARIEQGDLRISTMPADVNVLLSEVMDVMRLELVDGGKPEVRLLLDNHLPAGFSVKTDPLRLKQVLMNLMNNGIKFTKKGVVKLEAFHNDKEVIFNVEDTGIGIPKEKIPIIFERFRQVDESSTRVAGGNGLGLFISKNLVEGMGGNLKVRSSIGNGSIFSVVLPLNKVD
ncbi:PAS domain-containing sensor histidine kinase [Marinilabilia salmonicolor]|uniref:histidine kinase n=1 Tax=Marinilabilia salmonicolor TaxID=989 RepID=A0A368V8L2_9BACT|nr:PAS domain S-box protein [Marinilabilia salmonicolor]RCW37446.1 PAS domain S-box-containing protein [Marinilabilia salmonicolor]